MLKLDWVNTNDASSIYKHYAQGLEESNVSGTKTPGEFLQQLIDEQDYPQAIQFFSHALAPVKAVEWGCLCVRSSVEEMYKVIQNNDRLAQKEKEELSKNLKEQLAILKATEEFVKKPCDEYRRRAMNLAQSYGLEYSVSWCAMAAFWSQGSLAPVGEPEITPPPFLYTHGVVAALTLAVHAWEIKVKEPDQVFHDFIEKGIQLVGA